MEPTQEQTPSPQEMTFAQKKAAEQAKGEENVRNTIDKVVKFLGPLGNIEGFAKLYGKEAWKKAKEINDRVDAAFNRRVDQTVADIHEAIDTGEYTVQAIVKSGQEAGLGTMAGAESIFKTVTKGVPELFHGWQEAREAKKIAKAEEQLRKSRESIQTHRINKGMLREQRIKDGDVARQFKALQAQPVRA